MALGRTVPMNDSAWLRVFFAALGSGGFSLRCVAM
jgi:hypothetical protein